jgi:kinetochore protein Spc25
MTTFEPSLSTTMRASSHDAPSMADQLPPINFGFDDLRSRMNQFTARFDAFIENGRRRVLVPNIRQTTNHILTPSQRTSA